MFYNRYQSFLIPVLLFAYAPSWSADDTDEHLLGRPLEINLVGSLQIPDINSDKPALPKITGIITYIIDDYKLINRGNNDFVIYTVLSETVEIGAQKSLLFMRNGGIIGYASLHLPQDISSVDKLIINRSLFNSDSINASKEVIVVWKNAKWSALESAETIRPQIIQILP